MYVLKAFQVISDPVVIIAPNNQIGSSLYFWQCVTHSDSHATELKHADICQIIPKGSYIFL